MAKKGQSDFVAGTINIFTPALPSHANFVRKDPTLKTHWGKICVVGRAVLSGQQLLQVWARVYQKPADIPDDFDGNAIEGNVLQDGFFEFTGAKELSEARCNGSGTHRNYLMVWARFGGETIRLPEPREFYGKCHKKYCECDRPASTAIKKGAKKTAKKKAAKKKAKTAKKKAAKAAKKVVKKKTKRSA